MQILKVRVDKLIPHPKNPRIHHAVEKISNSIKAFGFTNPILVQKGTNYILAGHGRLEAAKSIGLQEVPIIELDLSDAQAKAYLIADNRIPQDSEFDNKALKDLLEDLRLSDFDTLMTGLDLSEINSFADWDTKFLDTPDAPAEEPAGRSRTVRTAEDIVQFAVPLNKEQQTILYAAIRKAKEEGELTTADALTKICKKFTEEIKS